MPLIVFIPRLLPLLACAALLGCSLASYEARLDNKVTATMTVTMTMVQVLVDNEAGVDGLDNPRSVKISPDGTHAVVASGDDNSLAIFDINDDFSLSFNRVFKNNTHDVTGLEGASQIAFLPNGNKMFTVSFYDSALVVLERDEDNQYRFERSLSDGLSIDRIFKDTEPFGASDTLGLLGAWDVAASSDGRQLLVASYKSNALSVFDIPVLDMNSDDEVIFNRVEAGKNGLGGAVGLALSADNTQLAVTGFDEHLLTLYNRTMDGELAFSQTLRGGDMGIPYLVNPQTVMFSPYGDYLYVACAGSNTLVVFSRMDSKAGEKAGKYALFQTLTDDDVGGGLKGVGSLAISPDGKSVFVAGEADTGVLVLRKENDGRLSLESKIIEPGSNVSISTAGANLDSGVLEGVSSLSLSQDGQYLLVTSAKHDSLSVFRLDRGPKDR